MSFTISPTKDNRGNEVTKGKKFNIAYKEANHLEMSLRDEILGSFVGNGPNFEFSRKDSARPDWIVSVTKSKWELTHHGEKIAHIDLPSPSELVFELTMDWSEKYTDSYGSGTIIGTFKKDLSRLALSRDDRVFAVYTSSDSKPAGTSDGVVEISPGEKRNFVMVICCLFMFVRLPTQGRSKANRHSMPAMSAKADVEVEVNVPKRKRANSDADKKDLDSPKKGVSAQAMLKAGTKEHISTKKGSVSSPTLSLNVKGSASPSKTPSKSTKEDAPSSPRSASKAASNKSTSVNVKADLPSKGKSGNSSKVAVKVTGSKSRKRGHDESESDDASDSGSYTSSSSSYGSSSSSDSSYSSTSESSESSSDRAKRTTKKGSRRDVAPSPKKGGSKKPVERDHRSRHGKHGEREKGHSSRHDTKRGATKKNDKKDRHDRHDRHHDHHDHDHDHHHHHHEKSDKNGRGDKDKKEKEPKSPRKEVDATITTGIPSMLLSNSLQTSIATPSASVDVNVSPSVDKKVSIPSGGISVEVGTHVEPTVEVAVGATLEGSVGGNVEASIGGSIGANLGVSVGGKASNGEVEIEVHPSASIVTKSPGQYLLTLAGAKGGEVTVEIKIDGRSVTGSPFSFNY